MVATSAIGTLQLKSYQALAQLRRKLRGQKTAALDLKIVAGSASEQDRSEASEPNEAGTVRVP